MRKEEGFQRRLGPSSFRWFFTIQQGAPNCWATPDCDPVHSGLIMGLVQVQVCYFDSSEVAEEVGRRFPSLVKSTNSDQLFALGSNVRGFFLDLNQGCPNEDHFRGQHGLKRRCAKSQIPSIWVSQGPAPPKIKNKFQVYLGFPLKPQNGTLKKSRPSHILGIQSKVTGNLGPDATCLL